ncbi:MAG TPA: protein kinase family protein [Verrucomicrobiae bacterium]|nr:protein kinase family protein [Verrucomicrobiae bacterium]
MVQRLGHGEISEVYLARRLTGLPLLATLKLSSSRAAKSLYAREAAALRKLHTLDPDREGPYYSRLLPEVIAHGAVEGDVATEGLAFVHPSSYWGSLDALNERFANGIDPRHAVWIWRRILDVLRYIHHHDWIHGDIRPEHALVDAVNHGVRLIGWASATERPNRQDKALDLSRSARVVQALLVGTASADSLPGGVPKGLAKLVTRAATDLDFCRTEGARGLDAAIQTEARNAFGPPTFLPLTI